MKSILLTLIAAGLATAASAQAAGGGEGAAPGTRTVRYMTAEEWAAHQQRQ